MKTRRWFILGVSAGLLATVVLVWHVHEHNLQSETHVQGHDRTHSALSAKPDEDEVDQFLESIKLENSEEDAHHAP